MRRTGKVLQGRRELLRRRLLQLLDRDTPGATSIDVQIDDLLGEILNEDVALQPALAALPEVMEQLIAGVSPA